MAKIPRTLKEAEKLLHGIGELQRGREKIASVLDQKAAALKAEHEQEIAPIDQAIEESITALRAWADLHRSDLLEGEAKTTELATGQISWRMSPPKLLIEQEEQLIKTLKRRELGQYVVTKESVNKAALLASPELVASLKGVEIQQDEKFLVKPFTAARRAS